ncbi:MAG: hypothetical protein DMF63_13325 [Acidobacteria bacterium]|nr:MAG: hypothetical protein DMF63_13325 [Acidobacteriota bacterium]
MLKIATFFALSALFVCAPVRSNAQTRTPDSTASLRPNQNLKVTTELQRQQKVLQDIAARYEEASTYDLTPLLKYTYVWSALRENRSSIALQNPHLTASQSRLFKKTYDLLEQDTLLSFLDHQMSLLNDSLELDEAQQEEVQKILTMDISNKRVLLSTTNISSKDFRLRLDKVSDTTEKHILGILYPEQRRVFDRQLMFNRDRLVG